MLHPNYELKIGSKEFKFGSSEMLLSLEVSSNFGLPIDCLEATLIVDGRVSFEKGDEIIVKLGYGSDLVQVFKGILQVHEMSVSVSRIFALGMANKLLNLNINSIYQNQTSADIVKSLAQEVGLEVKECEDGINYPYYVVDGHNNAYEHMIKLAERCDFDVYTTSEGKLIFKKFGGKNEHKIAFGKDVIQVDLTKAPKNYNGVVAFGESPSSSMGAETYHWLSKEELKAKTDGDNLIGIRDVSIKNSENVEKFAQAIKSRLDYKFFMLIETVGRAEVKLGDMLLLEGFSDSSIDGKHEIVGLEHSLSKSRGFVSRFRCRRK